MKHIRIKCCAILVATSVISLSSAAMADSADCEFCSKSKTKSWVFKRSTFTHDPQTNVRVAQYDRIAPVEALPDPREVTSGYRRTRTTLRGINGSVDSYYQVQNYGNSRGGLDAEWERFHDAWRQSTVAGGYSQYGYGGGYGGRYYGSGYGRPGYGRSGYGGPGYAPGPTPYGPAYGGRGVPPRRGPGR